jgi:hypothetical protein
MSIHPTEGDARARLRQEQAAEGAALRALQRARQLQHKEEDRLDTARADVAKAMVELVRVSGAERAARLTGEPLRLVRQTAREAGLTRSQIQ